ncbi:MAG: fibronectin type III domain-containing protein, partial [Myxococcota bacterium]
MRMFRPWVSILILISTGVACSDSSNNDDGAPLGDTGVDIADVDMADVESADTRPSMVGDASELLDSSEPSLDSSAPPDTALEDTDTDTQTADMGGPDTTVDTSPDSDASEVLDGSEPNVVPEAPEGLSAMAGDRQVTLTWEAVADAGAYIVARAEVDGPYSDIATVQEASYTDGNVFNRGTWRYTVRATNTVGDGPTSAEVEATPYANRRVCVTRGGHVAAYASLQDGVAPPPVASWGNVFASISPLSSFTSNPMTGDLYMASRNELITVPGGPEQRPPTGVAIELPWDLAAPLVYNPVGDTLLARALVPPTDRLIFALPASSYGLAIQDPPTWDVQDRFILDAARQLIVTSRLREDGTSALEFIPLDASEGEGVSPIRTLEGPQTTLRFPQGMAIDAVHDELWIGDIDRLLVFALDAEGDVAPLRVLEDPSHDLRLSAMAYDTRRDEILTLATDIGNDAPKLLAYSRTGDGEVSPTRIRTGEDLRFARELQYDPVFDTVLMARSNPPTVRILPGDGEGEVATLRVIQADRDLSSLAVAYDPEDQTLWMAAEDRGVLIFDATAPLSEPIAVLPAGQEGGFVSADEVVFDLAHREAWLSDTTTDTLYIHSMDEPTMPALRTLGGPNTTLDQATTLLFDPTRDEVIVANYGQGQALIVRPQIVSFPRDAQGNVAPIRTLAAPQILNNPIGLALDPTGIELIDDTMIALARENAVFRPVLEEFVRGEPAALLLVE